MATEQLWYKCNDNDSSKAAQFTNANSEKLSITDASQSGKGDALSPGDVDFYMCAWVYADTLATRGVFGKYQNAGNKEYLLQVRSDDGGRVQVRYTGSGGETALNSGTGTFLAGNWYLVESYHDAGSNVIGVAVTQKGSALSSWVTTAHTGGVIQGTDDFNIGWYTTTAYFDGRICSAAFLHEVPSDATREEFRNGGSNPLFSDLSSGVQTKCVAFWNLDEASGTRFDSKAASYDLTDGNTVTQGPGVLGDVVVDSGDLATNGTIVGGSTSSDLATTGKVNGGFLDVAGDYIDINQTLQAVFQDNFTISMWVAPDDGQPAGQQWFFGVREAAATGGQSTVHAFLNTNGTVRIEIQIDGTTYGQETDGAVFADGAETFHHLVMVVDYSSGIVFYKDGSVVASSVSGTAITSATKANLDLSLNLHVPGRNLDGVHQKDLAAVLDEFRILNGALTSDEVGYIYNAGAGSESSLADLTPAAGGNTSGSMAMMGIGT
jgi:hypothetical protein